MNLSKTNWDNNFSSQGKKSAHEVTQFTNPQNKSYIQVRLMGTIF
jgi:hypothetical protein